MRLEEVELTYFASFLFHRRGILHLAAAACFSSCEAFAWNSVWEKGRGWGSYHKTFNPGLKPFFLWGLFSILHSYINAAVPHFASSFPPSLLHPTHPFLLEELIFPYIKQLACVQIIECKTKCLSLSAYVLGLWLLQVVSWIAMFCFDNTMCSFCGCCSEGGPLAQSPGDLASRASRILGKNLVYVVFALT